MPRILGIDPSLTSTGVCVVNRDRLGNTFTAETTRIRTKPGDGSWKAQYDRMCQIVGTLKLELDRLPTLVSMEAPAFSRVQGHQHDRSGLWWMIYDACAEKRIPVITPTTNQRMQYATGSGNAQKDLVLAAAIKRWPDVEVSGNDVADALILAAIGCRVLGVPIDSVPVAHYQIRKGAKITGNWIEKFAA